MAHKLLAFGLLAVLALNLSGCAIPAVLVLWLKMPSEVRTGDTVPLKLTVKNSSVLPVKLEFIGRPSYDFIVIRPDDTEVWRWLHGKAIAKIHETRILLPGEELEFTAEWDQQDNEGNLVPPGTYRVRGLLYITYGESYKELKTQPKELVVKPR